MKSIIKNLRNTQWFFLLLVVIVLSIITGTINPKYFYVRNLINILEQISVLGLVASGATVLMISGNFDISVGANIGLASCVMAMLMKNDMATVLAVGTGLIVAVACCFFVGLNSILFKAPSFIISLACIGIFKGLALALTEGTIQTIYGKFETIGALRIFNVIPLLFVISLLGYITVHLILSYTRLGRRVYAIGSNRQAAYRSGIAVNKNTLIFFTLNGVLVGTAAMLLLSRVGAVQPSTGSGIELKAIGAVVIGGAPMTGGKGKIIGTFFGVLLMGVLSNVLNMLRVNPYFQEITFGALIIVSLAVTTLSQKDYRTFIAEEP
ncbi:sugar ABC transporter permease [candidate division KSB3 bacterium]|uniref:Sugar ABC transporter permease n=1 Tax=candidate division KSB3 bacterium TaxID=2044937 RepID=A0A2G6KEV3_9BACT|nr:MAG: sugar ABC transporter permease [candidate division KSB3 bacterium]